MFTPSQPSIAMAFKSPPPRPSSLPPTPVRPTFLLPSPPLCSLATAAMADSRKQPRVSLPMLFYICFLLSFPPLALAECDCGEEEDGDADKKGALKFKYIGIVVILLSSTMGILIPILGKKWPPLRPETNAFFLIKAFAAGVILATGMIHILPDAFESLTSPCLPKSPWQDFPFAAFVAMMTALLTLMIDTCATSYYQRVHSREAQSVNEGERNKDEEAAPAAGTGHMDLHTNVVHGHAHGAMLPNEQRSMPEHIRQRVVSQVLELGIVVHSVIIGISMGASVHPSTVRPLIGALCFHQFFEGMGLGGCIAQAKFNARATFIMALFFSLTTPVGIAVGIAITSRYDENSKTALMVEGLLDSASAGILIYMALVDLLAADFISPRMQRSGKLQLEAYTALLLGAGLMSVIAKWA
ncbi:hypothetical protein Taro_028479 [Colocasia esculenta]|uniref:Uncharacterized protein n=1 Tax=Colocasia esculenta TaxID=4460 RepID=A0A843VUB3_COLES|nr:hypothetical protein [Colocasia esculenta]